MDESDDDVPVVYIMGYHHSGSTLLDIALGSSGVIAGFGELSNLPASGWLGHEPCSCGREGSDCEFWSAVLEEWKQRIGGIHLEDYVAAQNHYTRPVSWGRLIRNLVSKSAKFDLYAGQTKELFSAIHHVSQNKILVDSSKNPRRALLLSMIPGIRVSVIHLVRDARAVTWSAIRKTRKLKDNDDTKTSGTRFANRPVWEISLRWVAQQIQSEIVRRLMRSDRYLMVRYEDFVAHPDSVLDDIGNFLHLDLTDVRTALSEGEGLQVGHVIAGNRLRMMSGITLKPDLEWTEKLPEGDRTKVWRIAGWLLRIYGYRKERLPD